MRSYRKFKKIIIIWTIYSKQIQKFPPSMHCTEQRPDLHPNKSAHGHIQNTLASHSLGTMFQIHIMSSQWSQFPVFICNTVRVPFKLPVSRTKLILRGEGCNGPTLIFILITLNHLNYELIKLGPAFQSSIFSFQFSIFFMRMYICML